MERNDVFKPESIGINGWKLKHWTTKKRNDGNIATPHRTGGVHDASGEKEWKRIN